MQCDCIRPVVPPKGSIKYREECHSVSRKGTKAQEKQTKLFTTVLGSTSGVGAVWQVPTSNTFLNKMRGFFCSLRGVNMWVPLSDVARATPTGKGERNVPRHHRPAGLLLLAPESKLTHHHIIFCTVNELKTEIN